MNNPRSQWCRTVLVVLATSLGAAAPALADKPDWAGKDGGKGGKGGKQERSEQSRSHGGDRDARHGGRFSDDQRTTLQVLYGDELRAGRCPPGLAKKRNGCLPPGQAKKWARGRPLGHDIIYYSLPPLWSERLGPPPAGHRYVRVASDILLIAIGTSMVVDAIEDLGSMR